MMVTAIDKWAVNRIDEELKMRHEELERMNTQLPKNRPHTEEAMQRTLVAYEAERHLEDGIAVRQCPKYILERICLGCR